MKAYRDISKNPCGFHCRCHVWLFSSSLLLNSPSPPIEANVWLARRYIRDPLHWDKNLSESFDQQPIFIQYPHNSAVDTFCGSDCIFLKYQRKFMYVYSQHVFGPLGTTVTGHAIDFFLFWNVS